ncbi:MAG: MarR family transcriptional regulator [Proteobacteria bacterium]|nr:MarR family transcriptional regulator [Pseudomonadota bacterium]
MKNSESISQYQVLRLRDLINEMVRCCEDRRLYEHHRFDVPYAWVKCLLHFDGERYLTVKTLAEKLDVAKSRVTKIVDGLVEKGLVLRMEDPGDARVKLISLTKKGEEKLREVQEFHLMIHGKILMQMAPEERIALISHLERLRAAMEVVKESFS